jgi:putative glutamine amidotransferase
MLPTFDRNSDSLFFDSIVESYIDQIDGLILQGGADINPSMYGQQPLIEYNDSDIVRDMFEIALFKKALDKKIPVLGICRGCQIINVALGGTLRQEINGVSSIPHVLPEQDENNYHPVRFEKASIISKIYPEKKSLVVNSIHHQAVDKLGDGLVIEAMSEDDVVEAISLETSDFVLGVQWHPEFMTSGENEKGRRQIDLRIFHVARKTVLATRLTSWITIAGLDALVFFRVIAFIFFTVGAFFSFFALFTFVRAFFAISRIASKITAATTAPGRSITCAWLLNWLTEIFFQNEERSTHDAARLAMCN